MNWSGLSPRASCFRALLHFYVLNCVPHLDSFPFVLTLSMGKIFKSIMQLVSSLPWYTVEQPNSKLVSSSRPLIGLSPLPGTLCFLLRRWLSVSVCLFVFYFIYLYRDSSCDPSQNRDIPSAVITNFSPISNASNIF